MAKDKDRTLNPAAAHRKQEKQKALKKGKAALLASRTARLATRNPTRLERQIADLQSSPALSPRDKKQLQDLEGELARVKKAREVRPDLVPQGGRGREGERGRGGGGGVLGKRSRDGGRGGGAQGEGEGEGEGSETDASVRRIPMPRDTPPPVPRPRPHHQHPHPHPRHPQTTNANSEPLGPGRERLQERGEGTSLQEGEKPDLSLPARPVDGGWVGGVESGRRGGRVVYEAKPQVRDLRKEAIRFLPGVVRGKIERGRGVGRLIAEEEVEGLERGGYAVGGVVGGGGLGGGVGAGQGAMRVDAAPEVRDMRRRLEEEEERFAREMAEAEQEEDDGEGGGGGGGRGVTMEEVEDEYLER